MKFFIAALAYSIALVGFALLIYRYVKNDDKKLFDTPVDKIPDGDPSMFGYSDTR